MRRYAMFVRPLIACLVCTGLVEPSLSASSQDASLIAARAAEDRSCVPFVFEGFVLDPDGAPAEGAVVVSSAGGRAVADCNGRYRLEARVPVEAESVQISALGSTKDLAAGTSVDVTGASRLVRVDPLALVAGAGCPQRWLPTFGRLPGMNGHALAFAVYDDGAGPALYAGGDFSSAGGVAASRIAKWNGSSWSALGSGLGGLGSSVRALAVWDDGSGPALFVAGRFDTAGDVPALNVARWDG